MENHIDRRVVLSQDSEFKGLYKWSLQEQDADGKKIGRDQIPWDWGLYFTASELALNDTLAIKPDYLGDAEDEKMAVREKRFIRAKLYPGDPGDRHRYRQTSYSMFGTDRTVSAFELFIEQLEDGDKQERCKVWGCVSYTTEIDFRDETTDDTIIFYLYVRPETFARYAERIAASEVDEAVLRVGRVAGFYSDWSPAISTDEIKVLTDHKEHEVEIPSDCEIDPPRLGEVMEIELYLRSISKLEVIAQDGASD